jgi:2-amino-4-hydroxy-6-hydroxymethyldihydropteridine diphosphokinase
MRSGVACVRKAYISAGSNLGNRRDNLESALAWLSSENAVKKVSSYFETEPVGYRSQPWFLNLAVEIETRCTPHGLLDLCQRIEDRCRRIRTFPNAPRTLDLDILIFEDEVICDERLIIPHPRLQDRRFVLEPLAQIAPDLIHPVLKKSIRELLEGCPDKAEAKIVSP